MKTITVTDEQARIIANALALSMASECSNPNCQQDACIIERQANCQIENIIKLVED